ncbi:MAG: thioredoxin family protein [Alphaproteobacteria bacterium]
MYYKFLLVLVYFIFSNICIASADVNDNNISNSFNQYISFNISYINHNNDSYITLNIGVKDGWKLYFKTSGDSGIPLDIHFKSKQLPINNIIFWPIPYINQTTENDSYYYLNNVTIPIKLISPVTSSQELVINGSICNNTCIPFNSILYINLNELKSYTSSKSFEELIKRNLILYENDKLNISEVFLKPNQLVILGKMNESAKSIIPLVENKFYKFKHPSIDIDNENFTIKFSIPNSEYKKIKNSLCNIILISENTGIEKNFYVKEKRSSTNVQNLYFIFLAFLGGVILNIMPCVLPVLSIKLLSLLNNSSEETQVIKKSFIYTSLGIIFSYLIIGSIAIILMKTGKNLGLGLYFQEPQFIIFISLITVIFITIQQGNIIIQLPSYIIDKLNNYIRIDKLYLKSFFEGVLATILATPCSTPFIGSAISFALTQSEWIILNIFLFMGIGFSLPYIILSFVPRLVKFLPRPGRWMVIIKQILTILLILTFLWLIYLYTMHTNFFAGSLLFLCGLFLKFILEQKKTIYKFFILPIFIISFILPNITYKDFHFFKRVTDEIWQEFSEEEIFNSLNQKKIIIVNITADWCTTCQYNKLIAFSKPEILKILYNSQIVAMQGDFTSSNLNMLKFINNRKRYGIPFTIIYGPNAPEGILLPEILSEEKLINAIYKAGYQNK